MSRLSLRQEIICEPSTYLIEIVFEYHSLVALQALAGRCHTHGIYCLTY